MIKLQTVQSSLDSWSIRKYLEPGKALSVALKNRDILLNPTEEVKFRVVARFLQFSIIYLLEQTYRLMTSVLLYSIYICVLCVYGISCFCFTLLYFAEVHLYPGYFSRQYVLTFFVEANPLCFSR